MTIGQLKEKIVALAKGRLPLLPLTLQDKLHQEYIRGYNKALVDVVVLIEMMKKIDNGK